MAASQHQVQVIVRPFEPPLHHAEGQAQDRRDYFLAEFVAVAES